MDALHRRGVCHGDLAPRNVLAGDYNNLTIIDFGRARVTEAEDYRTDDMERLKENFQYGFAGH